MDTTFVRIDRFGFGVSLALLDHVCLSQAMNQPYYPDLVFSLSELLDNGVAQHADLISELSAASSGEAQLKESLVSISKARTVVCVCVYYHGGT